jgi:hypothetical protein
LIYRQREWCNTEIPRIARMTRFFGHFRHPEFVIPREARNLLFAYTVTAA